VTVSRNPKRSWCLAVIKLQPEFKAQKKCLCQDYEIYLPLTEASGRRSGENVKRTADYFPRYFCILLDKETNNWYLMRFIIGVAGMVRFGRMQAVVSNNMVDSLKKNENEFGPQSIEKEELKQGCKVGIIVGLLKGYKAVYQKIQSVERVSVLFGHSRQNTKVILSLK